MEKWLCYFEEAMRFTVRHLLREADFNFVAIDSAGFFNWAFRWSPQVIQVVLWCRLTAEIEQSISETSLNVIYVPAWC